MRIERTRKEQAAIFMYGAIRQALDDMENGQSVCPATKHYLQVAIGYADTGREPLYDSRLGIWTYAPPEELS